MKWSVGCILVCGGGVDVEADSAEEARRLVEEGEVEVEVGDVQEVEVSFVEPLDDGAVDDGDDGDEP